MRTNKEKTQMKTHRDECDGLGEWCTGASIVKSIARDLLDPAAAAKKIDDVIEHVRSHTLDIALSIVNKRLANPDATRDEMFDEIEALTL